MMVCFWSSVLGIALFALREQWRGAPTSPDAPPPVHPAWTVPVGVAVFCAAAVLSWAMFYGPF
jgi:hypothetical protein